MRMFHSHYNLVSLMLMYVSSDLLKCVTDVDSSLLIRVPTILPYNIPRFLGNIGVLQSWLVLKPFLSSLHCLKVRLCVEQESRSMNARQAMLDNRLAKARERSRGGSRE